ncbi:hypothetical protein ACLB2K_019669 [Fragaria x ananassa]
MLLYARNLTMGATNHSDLSFLTLLLQDSVGGLQVLHQDVWIDIPPIITNGIEFSGYGRRPGKTRLSRSSLAPVALSRSPSPRRLALPALFSRPVRLLSQEWIVDGGDDDVVSDLPSERVREESGVDGGLEPRRGHKIQEIRELDEDDYISDDEEEIDDLSFDFESDSEGVQDGYGEEEFEA